MRSWRDCNSREKRWRSWTEKARLRKTGKSESKGAGKLLRSWGKGIKNTLARREISLCSTTSTNCCHCSYRRYMAGRAPNKVSIKFIFIHIVITIINIILNIFFLLLSNFLFYYFFIIITTTIIIIIIIIIIILLILLLFI